MENKFDKEQLYCPTCKHRWILISDKEITMEQHTIWLIQTALHHEKIKEVK